MINAYLSKFKMPNKLPKNYNYYVSQIEHAEKEHIGTLTVHVEHPSVFLPGIGATHCFPDGRPHVWGYSGDSILVSVGPLPKTSMLSPKSRRKRRH